MCDPVVQLGTVSAARRLQRWTIVGVVNCAVVAVGLLCYYLIGAGIVPEATLYGGVWFILAGIIGVLLVPVGLAMSLACWQRGEGRALGRALLVHALPLLAIPVFGWIVEQGYI